MFSLEIRQGGKIDVPTLLKTAETLLAAGVRRWAIIHFPEGVLAASHDGRRIFQPSLLMPPNQIAGTAGAGDAFAAGFLLGYHDELPMEDCLVFGVCAAAASLRHPSTTEGVERLDACLALGYEFGYRESIFSSSISPAQSEAYACECYRSLTRRWTSLNQ